MTEEQEEDKNKRIRQRERARGQKQAYFQKICFSKIDVVKRCQ